MFKINIVKILGSGNLIVQDSNGKEMELVIGELISKLTAEKDKVIVLLEEKINDKDRLLKYSESEIRNQARELENVQNERAALILKINSLYEDLSKKDLEKSAQLLQEAIVKFFEGDISEAINLLNDDTLQEELSLLEQSEITLRNKRRQIAESYIFKARLLSIQDNITGATSYVEKAIQVDSSYSINIAAGDFYFFLGMALKSEAYYSRALGLADRDSDRAIALYGIGTILMSNHVYGSARKILLESLTKFDLDDKANYVILSNLYETIATVEQLANSVIPAENYFTKGIELKRELSRENEFFLPTLATAIKNFAVFYRMNHNFSKAESLFNEAILIYQYLTKSSTEYHLELAVCYNECAIYYRQINQINDAKSMYNFALQICENFTNCSGRVKLLEASILCNIGSMLVHIGIFDDALTAYNKSLSIRKDQSLNNPERNRVYEAETLLNLGLLKSKTRDFEESEGYFLDAIKIYQEYSSRSSEEFLSSLTKAQHNLGGLYYAFGKFERAEKVLRILITNRRQLAIKNPDQINPLLSGSISMLGAILTELNQPAEAELLMVEALQIQKAYLHNQNDLLNYALMSINLARFYQNVDLNKAKSIGLIESAIILTSHILSPTFEFRQVQIVAQNIIENWDINWDSFLQKVYSE